MKKCIPKLMQNNDFGLAATVTQISVDGKIGARQAIAKYCMVTWMDYHLI